MPFADSLQHEGHESSVSGGFVFGTLGEGESDVAEEPVETDQRREVGRLQIVDGADEESAEDGVVRRKDDARENAELEELSHSVVLRGF